MGFGSEEGLHQKVCSNCGLRWVPVQRAQCINCGSDAGPISEEEWDLSNKNPVERTWDIPVKATPPEERAKRIVKEFAQEMIIAHGANPRTLEDDEIKLVWFNYTLGGWKALVFTPALDKIYYEVTYNKEKRETYLDVYQKVHNTVIPD